MREGGHAAVEVAAAIGVLLIPAALAVLSFGPWSERRVVAVAMADEAARAAVLALDVTAGTRVAAEIATNHGLAPVDYALGWCGAVPALPASGSCLFSRGGSVTVTVTVRVPMVATPWGQVGGLWVERTHSEPVDLYRSLE